MPRDHWRNGCPLPVDEDAGFTHAGDANRRGAGRAWGSVQCRPECFNRSIEQLVGGEVDTIRTSDPGGAGAPLADDLTLTGEDDSFCRGGPHVKTYEKCHVQNLRG